MLTNTLSSDANISKTLSIISAANGNSDAALVWRRIRRKLDRAMAHGLPVLDGAKSVRSTSPIARARAPSSQANGIRWAILVSTWAKTLGVASVGKRVSDMARMALADVSGTGRFADRRLVAWVGIANSTRHALDLRQRVSSVAWRALALGLVILSNADGILSAGVTVADVVASMVQSVAKLVRRAVDVVDARHLFTSRAGVVGISGEQSRWALAASDVVVDHADRLRSALDAQTSWEAAEHAINLPAGLRLGTLSVRGALVLEGGLAAVAVVGVSGESRQTLALTLVLNSTTG